MYFKKFNPKHDEARAQRFRREAGQDSRQRAAALRRQHEQATARLQGQLPFPWQVGQVKPRHQPDPRFSFGPPVIHIQLMQPLVLDPGTRKEQHRRAGDWLCQASLDLETGELRYDTEAAPWYNDGTGGPGSHYQPAPGCKRCLKRAAQLAATGLSNTPPRTPAPTQGAGAQTQLFPGQ